VFTSTAHVITDNGARYVKQLSSHLGRHAQVEEDGGLTSLIFDIDGQAGRCTLDGSDGSLVLTASADQDAALAAVETVVAGHLERFGQRDLLSVHWRRD